MIQKQLTRNNIILLICLLIFILLYPILSVHKKLTQNIIFTAIIIFGTFSLDFSEKIRRILMATGAITICLNWFYHFFPHQLLGLTFFISFFSFNVFITVFMTRHIARSKKVTGTIIVNSINGYLLIGILGAVLMAWIEVLQKYVFRLDTGTINFAGLNVKGVSRLFVLQLCHDDNAWIWRYNSGFVLCQIGHAHRCRCRAALFDDFGCHAGGQVFESI